MGMRCSPSKQITASSPSTTKTQTCCFGRRPSTSSSNGNRRRTRMFGSRSAIPVRRPPPRARAEGACRDWWARATCITLPQNETGLPRAVFPVAGRVSPDVVESRTATSAAGCSSPDPLQSFGVLLPAPHVDVGALGDRLGGFFIKRANRTGRRSQDERIVRKLPALSHHGASPDQAILSDPRAVEYDRAHADQAVRCDGATVQDHVMADDAIIADFERKSGVCVQHCVILNLRSLAKLDPLVVAT